MNRNKWSIFFGKNTFFRNTKTPTCEQPKRQWPAPPSRCAVASSVAGALSGETLNDALCARFFDSHKRAQTPARCLGSMKKDNQVTKSSGDLRRIKMARDSSQRVHHESKLVMIPLSRKRGRQCR